MVTKLKKSVALILAMIMTLTLAACGNDSGSTGSASTEPEAKSEIQTDTAQPDSEVDSNSSTDTASAGNGNILVVYFSWSGHLDSMAHWVADETGGDLYRVTAADPYPENYDDTADRAKQEKDDGIRPEIVVDITQEQMAGYDTVFFGFPVWWYDLPMSMWTFLESYDFSGKTIIPFFSHEGSSNGASALPTIETLATGATVRSSDALSIRGGNVDGAENEVREWVDGLGYKDAAVATATDPASETEAGGKTIVVYFSGSGNTRRVAEYVADETGADMFELVPVNPYTDADLDWTDRSSRVCTEHDDKSLQDVELESIEVPDWSAYDTVLFGYPLWWREAAWPVNTFVKGNDFAGKTVIPFCTSTSSGFGDSGKLLEEMAGTGDWVDGMRFSEREDEEKIREWVRGLDLD